MPGLLLLQLQFGQIKAALAGIGCAMVVVAIAVWTHPGFSGEGGEILGQPRSGPSQAPVAFSVSGLEGGSPGHSGAVPVDPILFANGSSNINSVVPVMAPVVAVGRT